MTTDPAARNSGRQTPKFAICRCRTWPPATAGEGWLQRALRVLFRWKASSIRADLKSLLEGSPGETGFSPEESTMLQNILGAARAAGRGRDAAARRHRRRAAGHSARRTDASVQSAGHSRLVVYNDTLDDPVGMVHIRDLIAFMTARAAVQPERQRQAQAAAAGRPRPQGDRSLRCRCRRRASSGNPVRRRPRCRRWTCSPRCRRRAFISRW